jgi:hypothetical protein
MGSRWLVALVALVIAACGSAPVEATPAATATPIPTPTPWVYPADLFQAHLAEYLDPNWTRTAPDHPYLDGGYLNTGLIVVSVDARQIISPLVWEQPYGEPGPPEWGLPFARTPEEVGTVVLVWAEKPELWEYSDGAKAYGEDWAIKIVDFEAKAVVGTRWFSGGLLPKVKYVKGDLHADPPWARLMGHLRQLPSTREAAVTPEMALEAACDGTPVPWAAPYAGKVHPLVVVDSWVQRIDTAYAINQKWHNDTWTSPIQLVVCVPDPAKASVKAGSCGRWKRTDGTVGELGQYRHKSTIRVVVAKTGKTLQSKVLYGSVPPCGDAPADTWSIPDMDEDPPWHLFGVEVTSAQVNKYATSVSTQPVR